MSGVGADPAANAGTDGSDDDRSGADTEADSTDPEELAAQVDLLAEENRRLRREYARAKRASYRRSAAGFAALGLVSTVAGVLFPGARTVLLALGGTGLFAAVLVAYLTPERFVAAEVGERVYAARSATVRDIRGELGLSDEQVYAPTPDGVRLYLPRRSKADLPPPDTLTATFVVGAADGADEARGVTLQPTGADLFEAFERTLQGPLAEDIPTLGEQLSDGLTDGLELVETTRVEPDPEDGRLTVGVAGSGYGPIGRPDHPVASFIAVGVATALDTPVSATVVAGDDRVDEAVTIQTVATDGEDD